MRWDSEIWKKELFLELDRFLKAKDTKKIKSDDGYLETKFKRFVFISSYIIRKLCESEKLSYEAESKNYSLLFCESIIDVNIITNFNYHHFDKHYNLDNFKKAALPLKKLCNTLIHSFVLFPCIDEEKNELEGIIFNSDKTKNHLYYEIRYFYPISQKRYQ